MDTSLLIHGYGIKRTAPLFYKTLISDGGFLIFSDLIKQKRAQVFDWGIRRHFTLTEQLNPLKTITLYKDEKNLAKSKDLLSSLDRQLQVARPSTIVCHSLGAYLFLNYLKTHSLPKYIKHIFFVQADIPDNLLENLSKNSSLKVSNIYCPWDYKLWGSFLLNRRVPIGIKRAKTKGVDNHLLPVSLIGVHTNGIRKNRHIADVVSLDQDSRF